MAQTQGEKQRPTPSCGPPCGRGGPGSAGPCSGAPLRSRPAWFPAPSGDPQEAQQPGPTHLQLGGRGHRRAVLCRAPPADSARAARPGPALRGRERALRCLECFVAPPRAFAFC